MNQYLEYGIYDPFDHFSGDVDLYVKLSKIKDNHKLLLTYYFIEELLDQGWEFCSSTHEVIWLTKFGNVYELMGELVVFDCSENAEIRVTLIPQDQLILDDSTRFDEARRN